MRSNDVSIIIPIYVTTQEGLEWLGECLDSAVSQDCEVVCQDDGSTVDILSIISKFSQHATYLPGSHVGVSGARNKAVQRASNSLILPLDCDDRISKGGIRKLLSAWDGTTPVYPDVRKFGLEEVPHYALLDFDCEHIYKHVGFSSVNVLHLKSQWKSIGGWNERIDFYEDGEYNARLFAQYCGKRFPEPLIEYRIHDSQRTKQYRKQSGAYAKKIMEMIRSLDMACKSCGRKRTSVVQNSLAAPVISAKAIADASILPGEREGRVLVQYVGGKGRGKHYYRGPRTKFPYKVIYGDYVYVDLADVRTSDSDNSLFIRVVKAPVAPAPVAAPKPAPTPVAMDPEPEKPSRSGRKDVEKTPVIEEEVVEDLPDIINMSTRQVLNLDNVDAELARKLLKMEKDGRNRVKVIAYLEGIVNG